MPKSSNKATVLGAFTGLQNQTVNEASASRSSMRETAQAWIREAILDGRYHAGEKLIERELCNATGASRSVLREALSHIEAIGLIVRQSYRGYTVTDLSSHSIDEIFELRAAVETLAAELFTERASEQEIADLKHAFKEVEAAMLSASVVRIRKAKEQFFAIIFSGCRNGEIRRALENVIDRVSYLRSQLMSDPQRRQDSLHEMRRLASALCERNRLEARAASLAHLESARVALTRVLAESKLARV